MIETIQTINKLLAIGGLASIVVTVFILIDFKTKKSLTPYIQRWGLHLAFLATIGSSFFTLLYSEYFGIIPCGLCWLERIALYPQILLLGVAIHYKDRLMPRYGIALSTFGLVVSLYHHYIQMGGSEFIKCPAAGAGAECAKRFFFEYGFMTFPLMAAFLFAFLIVIYMYILKTKSE